MTKGYLLSCDAAYSAVAQVCVESLLGFSKHPIKLVSYDWETSLDHERLLKERVPKPNRHVSRYWGERILRSPFDLTCMLDVDTVAAPTVDSIFDWHIDATYATYMAHPHAIHTNRFELWMRKLRAKPGKIPYVHGAPCLAAKKQMAFITYFQELLDADKRHPHNNSLVEDEQLTNFALRQVGATKCVPYGVVIDKGFFPGRKDLPWVCGFHGQKDASLAREFLTILTNEHNLATS